MTSTTKPTCTAHQVFLESDTKTLATVPGEPVITAGKDDTGNSKVVVQCEDGSKLIFVFAEEDEDTAQLTWEPPTPKAT